MCGLYVIYGLVESKHKSDMSAIQMLKNENAALKEKLVAVEEKLATIEAFYNACFPRPLPLLIYEVPSTNEFHEFIINDNHDNEETGYTEGVLLDPTTDNSF